MKKRSTLGRGVLYLRDSGGRHEKTPREYVRWANSKAAELGLKFDGTGDAVQAMIRGRESHRGDIFLDYDVCGNLFSRPGLDQLKSEVSVDRSISHILIPRRDRLARPDNPLDAVRLELNFRCDGITLVYMDQVCEPIPRGKRLDIADVITGVIDFDRAGKDRRELAQKILYAQRALARDGHSIGGRPSFGFRRWLVKHDGTKVRELLARERVKMPGHSVAWLPVSHDHPEMQLALRIREMLRTMPASRVAATLTAEGIPSPDAGRLRKDGGIVHQVSGVWHATTIMNIARNPLFGAIVEYGRRSMGDQLRFTADGPRELNDADYRENGKPKVIRNDEDAVVRSKAHFKPIVDTEQQEQLTAILDQRAGTQRGKPRSHDPTRNPLGSRLFDMGCRWPMYRNPYQASFRYVCGLYQQSHGQKCAHNHVDGPTATRFALSCLRQHILSPGLLTKLRARLRQMAEQESGVDRSASELATKKAALVEIKAKLATVGENMALAATPEQYRVVADMFEKLTGQQADLEVEVRTIEARTPTSGGIEAEIDAAMAVVDRLPDLAGDSKNLAEVGEAFRMVNLRMFLEFEAVQVKKRTLNKVAMGMITFGAAPPPIPIYNGRTARADVKFEKAATVAAEPRGDVTLPASVDSGREGNSLGNVNRGDSLCTFVDETLSVRLVRGLFPQALDFNGDAVLDLVEEGLYTKRQRSLDLEKSRSVDQRQLMGD
jgi:hypothetical protein